MGIRRGGPPPTDLGREGVEDLFVFHMLNVDGSLLAYGMVPTIKNFDIFTNIFILNWIDGGKYNRRWKIHAKEGAAAQRGSMTQNWVAFMVEVVSSWTREIISNSRDEMVGRKWRAFQDLTTAMARTQREDGTGCSGLACLLGKGDPVSWFCCDSPNLYPL